MSTCHKAWSQSMLFRLALWILVALGLTDTGFSQDDNALNEDAITTEAPFQWEQGPTRAQIGTLAEIEVPEGYRFNGAEGTQMLLQMMQNPISGEELGMLMPNNEESNWFVVFEFSSIGYVKDDEKDELDADVILDSIRQGTEQGNKERAKRGWPKMSIVGWEQAPCYNAQSQNLEWAVRAKSEGELVVNYNTRVLGRTGVMEAGLVINPEDLSTVLPKFRQLLNGYTFKEGSQYADFHKGDKVAQYGLTALVTGGAAAVALKTGLFQKFWKLIVILFIAIGGFFKKLFGGGSSRSVT
jgi:uncharacterized membrane-anchored protein